MSQYPIMNQSAPAAEFILSEAPGHRSRENAQFLDPAVIEVGMPLTKSAPRTPTALATYIPAVAAADCEAIAIYGGVSTSGTNLALAIIARDAEVNAKPNLWPSRFFAAANLAATENLATKSGIMVRDKG